MNHDIAALPELLQDEGYFTATAGKWHLGYKDEFGPHSRGFDQMPGTGKAGLAQAVTHGNECF